VLIVRLILCSWDAAYTCMGHRDRVQRTYRSVGGVGERRVIVRIPAYNSTKTSRTQNFQMVSCICEICMYNVHMTPPKNGGVMGRPEAMCPVRIFWDPWSQNKLSWTHSFPELLHPCHFASYNAFR